MLDDQTITNVLTRVEGAEEEETFGLGRVVERGVSGVLMFT